MSKNLYPVAKKLSDDYSRHCATLAFNDNLLNNKNDFKNATPDENSRNGTLTFIKSEGKVFAITCWHVIEFFRDLLDKSDGTIGYSLFTMQPRPFIVIDRFIRPSSLTESHKLDIVICQVRAKFVEVLGKEPIDIDNQNTIDEINFGIAVGFPEALKYEKENENDKKIISLPTVTIIAEIDRTPDSRFTLFSEFETIQGYETYSGMSGGPIFWSTSKDYGIYGISCQANSTNFTEKGKSVMITGEIATRECIKHWISQIPKLFDDENIFS
ncbi:trypsin-like peptidase domain-containing protein [Flavobacterium sp. SUN046]|uniref:trypsin-like peptidase domain-containing protein n=1 Tax=Flavobacterium sp. SUN046 TaxID=3002440 RepID=UPI002DBC3A27|nr:trypsin-like peptidase domain-containing protein [Flavobacterium sp. SUN046]MEC4049136.1 trypsin-like peptidase domain-containing protein [Flavobacterium sp. SUN046]